MKNLIIKNKRILIYFGILIFSICIFYNLFPVHYSTDTYRLIDIGYENYATNFSLIDGRLVMAIICFTSGMVNLDINIFVFLLTFLGIAVSSFLVMMIANIIMEYKKSKNIFSEILIYIISYIIVFNFMYIENIYFTEIFVMSVSLVLLTFASKKIVNEKYLQALLYVILAMFFYQGTINFFITLTIVLLLIKYNLKDYKKLIKPIIISGIICVLAVATNLVQIKIVSNILNIEQSRLGSIQDIFNNVKYIINNMNLILIKSSELFPNGLFIIFLTIIWVYICGISIKKKQNYILPVFIIILISILSSIAINIFTLSSFGLGRMCFSVGAVIGLIFMYLYCKTDIFEETNMYKNIIIMIIFLYFIVNVVNYMYIFGQHKLANELDLKEVNQIKNYIEEYEFNTNKKIEKIAIVYDKNPTWYYNNLNHKSLYTHRGLMIWWCNNELINFVLDRKLEKIKMPTNIYKEYFEGKDWDELNKEQIILIENTLYYCVY